MSEYVDFHYMPLEGKITGEQVLKQTEDAINDLGNKVHSLDIDQSEIDEAIEKSNEAINTANSALAAVTTGRSVWFNNVAEMVATDIEAGVTAETKGYYVANDGGNALYLIRQEKSGDVVDGGSLIALDNGNMAELVTDGTVNVKQFGAIGNGADDDTTVFQNTSSYAQAKGFVPFVGVATYKITSNITGTFNSFGEVTITGGGTVDIINLHEVVSDVSDIRDEVVDETASAKAYSESAATSATNASNSASSASTTATQLMEYLETKGEITAPAVDPTLTISGAAADAKVTGAGIKELYNKAPINIIDPNNVLAKGKRVNNACYRGSNGEYVSNSLHYYIVPVVSGVTYHFASIFTNAAIIQPRYITTVDTIIVDNSSNVYGAYDYTANFTGDLYVTYTNSADDYGYLGSNFREGSYVSPRLSILGQDAGVEKGLAPSQYGARQIVANYLKNVIVDKNLLLNATCAKNVYIQPAGAQAIEMFRSNSSLDTYSLYVTSGHTYIISPKMRFMMHQDATSYAYSTDSSGTATEYSYTATATGILHISFVNQYTDSLYVYDSADVTDATAEVSTLGYPLIKQITQTTGASKVVTMSQKAITDAINTIIEQGAPKTVPYYKQTSASLTDSGKLEIGTLNVTKNVEYAFTGRITSFAKMYIGHGDRTTNYSSWLEITQTQIIVHNYRATESTQEETHGLTFTDYLSVRIKTDDAYKAEITIETGTTTYTFTANEWYGNNNGTYYAEMVTGTLTDVVFTLTLRDALKKVYLFGDSYLAYTYNNRWIYYLKQDGYLNNILVNAFGGENSNHAINTLNNMTDKHPDYAVWIMGMNDGSDTNDTTPTTQWLNGYNAFLSWCNSNNVTPILATIPNVPAKNHKGKNYTVRNSGYRYIDFAKAVGSDISTSWYTDMLGSDNEHPAVLGAKALYQRVLLDFPELICSA